MRVGRQHCDKTCSQKVERSLNTSTTDFTGYRANRMSIKTSDRAPPRRFFFCRKAPFFCPVSVVPDASITVRKRCCEENCWECTNTKRDFLRRALLTARSSLHVCIIPYSSGVLLSNTKNSGSELYGFTVYTSYVCASYVREERLLHAAAGGGAASAGAALFLPRRNRRSVGFFVFSE